MKTRVHIEMVLELQSRVRRVLEQVLAKVSADNIEKLTLMPQIHCNIDTNKKLRLKTNINRYI